MILRHGTFSYLPDLRMLVQVFPYDYWMPISSSLLAGPPSELEPLFLSCFGPYHRQEFFTEESIGNPKHLHIGHLGIANRRNLPPPEQETRPSGR